MSDQPPPLAPPPLPNEEPFLDRRSGLRVFGVLEIVMGAGVCLMVPVTYFGAVFGPRLRGQPSNQVFLMPTLLLLAGFGAGIVWLGFGSFRARRWARALLLILGWIGLVLGASVVAMLPLTLGTMDEAMKQAGQEVPAAVLTVIKIITVVISAVIYLGIPLALVLFYRSRQVKRTCEKYDPDESWTDRCPLPVLAACLLLACGGICGLTMLPSSGSAIPFGDRLITGWPSRALWLALSGLALWFAWRFYHLDRRAWIAGLVTALVLWAGWIYSLHTVGLERYYRAIGLSQQEVRLVMNSPLLRGNTLTWLTLIGVVPYVAFFLWIGRYFPSPKDLPPAV